MEDLEGPAPGHLGHAEQRRVARADVHLEAEEVERRGRRRLHRGRAEAFSALHGDARPPERGGARAELEPGGAERQGGDEDGGAITRYSTTTTSPGRSWKVAAPRSPRASVSTGT